MLPNKVQLLSVIILFFLLSSFLNSAVFSLVIWSQTYGEEGTPTVADLIETYDGGFAIFGITGDFNRHPDFLLIKTDENGVMLWNQTYGKINSDGKENVDRASCILQTDDGGYLLAGTTGVYASGNSDIWLIKIDGQGNMIWNKTYGQWFNDYINSIIQTSDGNFILGGTTYSIVGDLEDFYVLKINSYGNLMWNRTYGTANRDYGSSIVETSDGGYALGGYVQSARNGTAAYQLLKIDSVGNMLWNHSYGWNTLTNIKYSFTLNDVIITSDGGFALGGTRRITSPFYPEEFFLVKTDENGVMLWNQTYGPAGHDTNSLILTSDGEYAFTSVVNSNETLWDVWFIKTDTEGNVKLNQTYSLIDRQEVRSLVQTSDGGYAFAGQIYTDEGGGVFWLFRTDVKGIPEFPSWFIIPSVLTATLVLVILRKKLKPKKSNATLVR